MADDGLAQHTNGSCENAARAFVTAVNDPELLAEAKKKTMDEELISGEEIDALAKEVVNQPAEIVARLKKLLGE